MKLIFFIILAACLQVSAHSGYSQTVTFSGKNVPLPAVFASIEKQTGLSFFFNMALIKDTRPVTLDLKAVSLEDALHEALKGQGLDFYQMGKTIFIVKKQPMAAGTGSPLPEAEQPLTSVKGRVVNQQGEALEGATVALKNGRAATLTNERGEFELKGVVAGAILEITHLGYQRREIKVESGDIGRVEMALSDKKLDEVQVVAYWQTSQRLGTGNVTTVRESTIEKQPVSNPLLALEGRVPGLLITQSTGLPGSGVTVRVEGQNSISKGNDPLYVIDGVPYISQLLPTLSGVLGSSGGPVIAGIGSGSGNPLSYINPGDIASIVVLKDADATAIYGSRAANGAILITTKKGKIGKTRADINVQNGWGNVARKLHLLNTQQYLQMRREGIKNDGLAISSTDYDINGLWDSTRYTDWQKALLGSNAQYSNAQVTFSGGNSMTQYLVGGGYHRETTVFPGDLSDQKEFLHFNITNVSENQRFRIQLSGNYLIDNNRLANIDFTNSALVLAPDAPPLYNSDGSINWMLNAAGTATWTNPVGLQTRKYNNKANNLISNSTISYQILPGLEIKSNFGYTNMLSNEYSLIPLNSYQPQLRPNLQRGATYSTSSISSWIVEPQASYKFTIGRGTIEALAGATIQQNNTSQQQLSGSGYNSDLVMEDIKSAATVTVGSTIAATYKYNAVFARLNYNWDDELILNLTARRDGSSRFGSENQFHNFGAAGIGWIFSRENFIQRTLPVLSFGKLRSSYGTTGNDQIGDYQFLNLYSVPSSVGVAYQGATGLAPNGLPNPYLQWESTRKLEFGVDLGFFMDKVLVTANYFLNRSSNELLSYNLPFITGFSSIQAVNFPATIQNSGWEFSANATIIKTNQFTWTSDLNFTIPQNKLLSFPNLSASSYASQLVIGQPFTITRAYHFLGVDPATGVFAYTDSHENPTSSPSGATDRPVLVNTSPRIYGGFGNNFRYKRIELDIMFQFVKQKGQDYIFGTNLPGSFNVNQPTSVLDRWEKPGDVTRTERYDANFGISSSFNPAGTSDVGYSDASYIRLKNLSLSWQLATGAKRKMFLQSCKLYVQGQNLLTITKYKGLDPENKSVSILPPLRVLTAGVQITL